MIHYSLASSRYGQNSAENCFGFWLSDAIFFPNSKQYSDGSFEAFWIEKPEVVKDRDGNITYDLQKKDAVPLLISSRTGYAVPTKKGIINPRTGFPYKIDDSVTQDFFIEEAEKKVLEFTIEAYQEDKDKLAFLQGIDLTEPRIDGVNHQIQETVRILRPFHNLPLITVIFQIVE
jgi:hypothetical protein